MNVTALALLSLATGLGQAPTPAPVPSDVQVTKGRSLALGIRYNPDAKNQIQEARLYISQDQGQTWFMRQSVMPPANEFVFTAKEDGLYYINMQLVYTNGTMEPADVSRVAPAQKLIIDSTPPVVRVTNAVLNAEELSVDWTIEDKFPNDKATVVRYRAVTGSDADWQSAGDNTGGKRSIRFKPMVAGPLLVQVIATDLAGNVGRGGKEVTPSTSSAYPPTTPLPPPVLSGTEPVPSTPVSPPTIVATEPAVTPTPVPITPVTPAPKPIAGTPGTMVSPTTTPLAAPAVTPQPVEAVQTQMIRTPRFELGYQLEGGPSGVARVDLYVTRDDGRNWVRWSTHAGTESPLKVVLDTRFNPEIEGDYGFKLVPVSGAGLSDGAPTVGTAPEMKVHVDSTAPVIKVFQPTLDPINRGALMLHWEATDRNFGKDPIAIEYSETATGPWKTVTGGDIVPVAVGMNNTPNRIANTGSYSWQLPANLLQPRLYLKFTAWDLAGNKSEVVTPNPVLVDLTKPKAKIQGILPSNPGK